MISFPEYAKEKIKKELNERREEESEKLCLAFAEEYFQGLERVEEKQRVMVERYAKGGEIRDRVIMRVKEFLFQKMGPGHNWFAGYIRATKISW